MKAPCFLRDQTKGMLRRPCAKCAHRGSKLFRVHASEASVPCEWWAAENEHGDATVFRCFPGNRHGLTKSAEERFAYLATEYKNALRNRKAELGRRYRKNRKRGKFWALIKTNSEFRRLLDMGKVTFRPAYACEVALWLETHIDDMLTMPEHEKLLSELELFV